MTVAELFTVDPGPEGQLVELPALVRLCGDGGSHPGVGWEYIHAPPWPRTARAANAPAGRT